MKSDSSIGPLYKKPLIKVNYKRIYNIQNRNLEGLKKSTIRYTVYCCHFLELYIASANITNLDLSKIGNVVPSTPGDEDWSYPPLWLMVGNFGSSPNLIQNFAGGVKKIDQSQVTPIIT